MISTIYFYYQFLRKANEICNITINYLLLSERLSQLRLFQILP